MRKLFVTLVTVAVLLAVVPAVSAGGWKDQPGELTVTVDAVAETYTYHGTGFDPSVTASGIYINECRPGCTASFLAEWVTGDGEFTITRPFGFPGEYTAWTVARVCVGGKTPCDPVNGKTKLIQITEPITFTVP